MLFNSFFTSYAQQEQLFDDFLSQHGGKYRRIMDEPVTDDSYVRSVAEMKRFLEVYTGKIEVRQRCNNIKEAQKVADEIGLSINVDDFRIVWDSSFLQHHEGALWFGATDWVWRHRGFVQEKVNHRAKLQQHDCVPKNERLRLWRRRQMNRIYTEMGTVTARAVIHSPLMFELSNGCSVGCWFCGVAAKKKGGDFLYTPENVKLWRNILEFFNDFLGSAAGTGTCYYGTEPLDNPDYEKWCDLYADILGNFPQTTTAIALQNVERTRHLIHYSRSRGAKINRFSVLNTKILDQIHAAFSPLELLYTELLTQNLESVSAFSHSGRAREHREMFEKKAQITGTKISAKPSSICCITGFRLNMVRKTIELVTPCGADEIHPHGEYLLASGTFNDVRDIEQIVTDWIKNIIVTGLLPRNLVTLRPDLTARLDAENNKMSFQNYTGTYTYTSQLAPFVFESLQSGQYSAYQIAEQVCETNTNFSYENVFAFLNELFQDGFFNESPEFFSKRRFEYQSPNTINDKE
jgi:radical SAM family RiPP maturation amino acid epimerase